MNYKALLLDVDGTLIPYDYDALPSDKVCAAIKKAQEKVTVGLVTGRSYGPQLSRIIEKLNLTTGYVVSDTGGHVVKLPSGEELYDRPIESSDLQKLMAILFDRKVIFYAKSKLHEETYLRTIITPESNLEKAYMIYSNEIYSEVQLDLIMKELSAVSGITVTKTRHKEPDKFGINIVHTNATKLHGAQVIMKDTGITKEEIIAAGDSYNDFPLLMAAGKKVAMGNAIEDLKAVADYVAPTVEDDGVATIIEKFILS